MAATIPRGSDHFFTTIYEGNGKGQRVGKFVPFTDDGTIAKSCIFNSGDGPVLSHVLGGDGNKKKFTISAWVKPCKFTGDYQAIVVGGGTGNGTASSGLYFNANMQIYTYFFGADALITNRTFEDTSKFYHIVLRVDTSDSTADDRIRMYVDGTQITSFATRNNPSQDAEETLFNVNGKQFNMGKHTSGNAYYYLDSYLAEVNFADGQSYGPETFGLTDTSTGRWIPKSLTGITYGTNGFRAEFANSAGQTIGDDTSGQSNDFTVTNVTTSDITTDSPTQNHATLEGTGGTLTEGNLKLVTGNSDFSHQNATLKPTSGKYYAEFTVDVASRAEVGVASTLLLPYGSNSTRLPEPPDGSLAGYMYYGYNGRVYYNSSNSYDVTYATYTTNDIIGIALDLDNHTVQFFKNNVSQGTLGLSNGNYTFVVGDGATGYNGGWTANFGQKSFTYTPPTDFVALQQDNLPTNDKGIPDLVWFKNRDRTKSHTLYDSSRGKHLAMFSTGNDADTTYTDGLQKFLKGGCQIEDNLHENQSGDSFVAWNWVANNGVTATNNDGESTSIIQVNDTAKFSIGTFTSKVAEQTIGHGLGVAPEFIILKRRDGTQNWMVYHKQLDLTDSHYLHLNASDAEQTGSDFGNDVPTSTVFHTNVTGTAGRTYVFYAWAPVEGFSKFGTYVGNGSTDGTFVYTGFKPAWVLMKRSNSTGNWYLKDTTRDVNNRCEKTLMPNQNNAEAAQTYIDIYANGFKQRIGNDASNLTGSTYMYFAFAEHPFHGADGITVATAR